MSKNQLRNKTIKKFRKFPRKPWIWKYLHPVIDEILKEKLKNAPILKYKPESWINPLYRAYYVIKSHYWSNIYRDFIQDLSGTNAGIEAFSKQFLEGAYRFINLDAPLYIRVISLLLRIIIDRYGIAKYDNLPPLPINLYKEPEFHMVGTVNYTIHKYIDKITNNASLEIKEFFIEAIGINSKEIINPCLNQNILLPIPFFLISNYLGYQERFRERFSKILSTRDEIDHAPIRVRDRDGQASNSTMILYSQGSVNYISKYNFSKLVIVIAEFIKEIYLELSISSEQKEEVQNICNFFYHFFQSGTSDPTIPVKAIYTILETQLLLKDIDEESLHKFTYNPRETEKSLADPFQVENLFKYSLDLFNKPFIRDPYGSVIFSTLWLFDSLISKLTWLLREKIIGTKRGIKGENYYAFLIEDHIKRSYPDSKLQGPFKIILKNKDLKKDDAGYKNYKKMKSVMNHFKFDIFEFEIPSTYMELEWIGMKEPNKYDFFEFDIVFVWDTVLYLIEVKDDLFWDVRDLPYYLIRWGFNLNRKLEKQAELFNNPNIKTILKTKNIEYHEIKTSVITQKNIQHSAFNNIDDFYRMLDKIKGKMIMRFGANFPPYPW